MVGRQPTFPSPRFRAIETFWKAALPSRSPIRPSVLLGIVTGEPVLFPRHNESVGHDPEMIQK